MTKHRTQGVGNMYWNMGLFILLETLFFTSHFWVKYCDVNLTAFSSTRMNDILQKYVLLGIFIVYFLINLRTKNCYAKYLNSLVLYNVQTRRFHKLYNEVVQWSLKFIADCDHYSSHLFPQRKSSWYPELNFSRTVIFSSDKFRKVIFSIFLQIFVTIVEFFEESNFSKR